MQMQRDLAERSAEMSGGRQRGEKAEVAVANDKRTDTHSKP